MNRNLIIVGLGLLLTGSYLDNLRGLLLPVITHQLHLNYSHSSWFLVAGTAAAILWNLSLILLNRKFSKREIVLTTCVAGFFLMAAGFLVGGFIALVAFGFLLGIFISAAGAMANLLVMDGTDAKSRSRFLCLLHLMYGLGSFLAPTIGGLILDLHVSWPYCLLVACIGQASLFFFSRKTLPKVERKVVRQAPDLGKLEPASLLGISVFGAYVAGEVLVSAWMSTYLVEAGNFSISEAAPYVTGFFAMMALTRGLCFLTIRPVHEKWILTGCLVVSAAMFTIGRLGYPAAFSLAGILGPFFPIFLSRMATQFPKSAATVSLVALAAGQLTLALGHVLMGEIIDHVGIATGYWLPPAVLAFTVLLLLVYFAQEKSRPIKTSEDLQAF